MIVLSNRSIRCEWTHHPHDLFLFEATVTLEAGQLFSSRKVATREEYDNPHFRAVLEGQAIGALLEMEVGE